MTRRRTNRPGQGRALGIHVRRSSVARTLLVLACAAVAARASSAQADPEAEPPVHGGPREIGVAESGDGFGWSLDLLRGSSHGEPPRLLVGGCVTLHGTSSLGYAIYALPDGRLERARRLTAEGIAVSDTLRVLRDMDGDGADEILVAVYGSTMKGSVRRLAADDEHEIWSITESGEGDFFGSGISPVDDLDGDGVQDVVIATPFHRAERWLGLVEEDVVGRLEAYSGRTGDRLWRHDGERDRVLAEACVGVPDQDGDGVPDVLAGQAPFLRFDDDPGSGRVLLLSGADGRLLRVALRDRGEFGEHLARVGDCDSDGVDDVAISAAGTPGRVVIVSGATLAPLFAMSSTHDGTYYGRHVLSVEDCDGDDVRDLVVACPVWGGDDGGGGSGCLELRSGRTGDVLGVLEGPADVGRFGDSLLDVGNGFGDGSSMLIVGCGSANGHGLFVVSVAEILAAGAR